VITNHNDRSINKWYGGKKRTAVEKASTSFHFCSPPISTSFMRNAAAVWIFLWNHSSWFLLLQQPISNHSETFPEGTGKENESSKYRQWPLQTPSMINVKGLLFLICQSFQRSLTYVWFQPCCSHHSSRWSGTSKPITTRFCWGWCCQSCKLAHLQPFIMHCSKEQHVFLREGRCGAM